LVAVDSEGDTWARVSGRGRHAVRRILRLMRGQGWATRATRATPTPEDVDMAALTRWYRADAPRVAAMLATGGEEAHEEARHLSALARALAGGPVAGGPGCEAAEAALAAWSIIARGNRAGGAL
jgi:hypothetical protein